MNPQPTLFRPCENGLDLRVLDHPGEQAGPEQGGQEAADGDEGVWREQDPSDDLDRGTPGARASISFSPCRPEAAVEAGRLPRLRLGKCVTACQADNSVTHEEDRQGVSATESSAGMMRHSVNAHG